MGRDAEQIEELIGRRLAERLDSIGPGPVQRVVDGLELAGQFCAAVVGLCEDGTAVLLMLDQLNVAFGDGGLYLYGLFKPPLLWGHGVRALVDGLLVSPSPASPDGPVGDRLRVGQAPFGVSALGGGDDQLSSGLGPFAVAVDGEASVDAFEGDGQCAAGVAEPIDPVGEGIISPDAGGDDFGPVVIEAALQRNDFGSLPPVGLLEAIVGRLLSAQVLDGGRGEGGGRCCLVGAVTIGGECAHHWWRRPRPWRVSPRSAPMASSRSAVRATADSRLVCRCLSVSVGVCRCLSVPGSGQFLDGPGDSGSSRQKVPLTCDFLERTTGFEPATLTLAR